jgi:hypothetical protein
MVGNGHSILFWSDNWLQGKSISIIPPSLFSIIPKRIAKSRTIYEALLNNKCIYDIRGGLTVGVLADYFKLWDCLSGFELHPLIEDRHIFSIAPDGKYSAKEAYKGLFLGSCTFGHYKRVWKTWAPSKCRFFLWLVAHNRCWTADRLAKMGSIILAVVHCVIKNLKLLTTCWSHVCLQGFSGIICSESLGWITWLPSRA